MIYRNVLLTHIPECMRMILTVTFAGNDVVHLEENMNDDLTKITEWLTANKLTLNKS